MLFRDKPPLLYQEYCEKGRSGKAYATIKKQDPLWNNHIAAKFGNRYIDDITAADSSSSILYMPLALEGEG